MLHFHVLLDPILQNPIAASFGLSAIKTAFQTSTLKMLQTSYFVEIIETSCATSSASEAFTPFSLLREPHQLTITANHIIGF